MSRIKKLPGFRSGSPRNMAIAGFVYVIVFIGIIGSITDAIGITGSAPATPTPETEAAAVATAVDSAPTATAPPTATPEPEPTKTPASEPTPTPTPIAISQEAIDDTVEFLLEHSLVRDAAITVKEDAINMVLQVNDAINDETVHDRLDTFARYFASRVAHENESLRTPGKDDLGGLWDHYTLHIGAIDSAGEFIARGAKVPSSPKITW